MAEYVLHLNLEANDPLLTDEQALQEQMAAMLRDNAEAAGYRVTGDVAVTVMHPNPDLFERVPDGHVLVRGTASVERGMVAGDTSTGLLVMGAVLGWSNGDGGQSGGENLQLYALDDGPGPRWLNPPHGRTVETALRERGGSYEGDRMIVVRLPDSRRVTDDDLADTVRGIAVLLQTAPPVAAELAESATTVAEAEAVLIAAQQAAQQASEAHALTLITAQQRLTELRDAVDHG